MYFVVRDSWQVVDAAPGRLSSRSVPNAAAALPNWKGSSTVFAQLLNIDRPDLTEQP